MYFSLDPMTAFKMGEAIFVGTSQPSRKSGEYPVINFIRTADILSKGKFIERSFSADGKESDADCIDSAVTERRRVLYAAIIYFFNKQYILSG